MCGGKNFFAIGILLVKKPQGLIALAFKHYPLAFLSLCRLICCGEVAL